MFNSWVGKILGGMATHINVLTYKNVPIDEVTTVGYTIDRINAENCSLFETIKHIKIISKYNNLIGDWGRNPVNCLGVCTESPPFLPFEVRLCSKQGMEEMRA